MTARAHLIWVILIVAGSCLVAGSLRTWPTLNQLRQPAPSRQPSEDAETSAGTNVPLSSITQAAAGLSAEEIAQGFQLVTEAGSQTHLIVHPHSPCWIEVPAPQSVQFPGPDPALAQFVGPEACMPCHKENFKSFVHTSHYRASQAASSATIRGSFASDRNRLDTNHPDLSFTLTQSDDGAYIQNAHLRSLTRSKPFDIVTGSGNLAQTYLYWEGDGLYQLHVSYYTQLNSWINSPGYHDGTAWFARKTIPKCVECHMTYVQPLGGHEENRYNRGELILGVTCERCHGPGSQHVSHHQQYPGDRQPRFITNPSRLSREATNDVCAQCHLGSADPLQPPFSFRPGDRVEEFWKAKPDPLSPQGNVHSSNQLQRLQMSACFIGSQMTCLDCHNPHRPERGNLKLFSERCVRCHQPENCPPALELGQPATDNCIDCHMGMGYDDHIQMQTSHEVHMPLLRDHNVRVLPEASQRFRERYLRGE